MLHEGMHVPVHVAQCAGAERMAHCVDHPMRCTTLMSLRDRPVWHHVSAEGPTAFQAHRVKLVCPSATSVKPSRATASDRAALGR